jgi:hypothetical protein
MKKIWPMVFIVAGAMFLCSSMGMVASHLAWILIVLAYACFASGIVVMIANRKYGGAK